jgi:ABC-type phosphate/phosphonate transport system substrate-binding protein
MPQAWDTLVDLQGCPAAEVFVTVTVPEGHLSCVDALVDGKVDIAAEVLPAHTHL